MTLLRVKTEWTGFTGAPGYTVMHFNGSDEAAGSSPDQCHEAVHTFFTAIASRLPGVVRLRVDPNVERLDEASGEIVAFELATDRPVISGTTTGNFSSATGACITWMTAGVRNGRRIRGRTFLVPLASAAYDTDGTLNPTARTNIETAAQALNDDFGGLVVFSRPSGPGATDGQAALVTGVRVTDKTAILRSRRD